MYYLLGVQIDESVPLPTGADWEAPVDRVGVVNDDMTVPVPVPVRTWPSSGPDTIRMTVRCSGRRT